MSRLCVVFAYFGLIALVCLAASGVAESVRCESIFAGNYATLPPVQPSVCAAIINYPVAVPDSSCQSVVEAVNLGKLATVSAVLSEECRVALAPAMCMSTFPHCVAGADVDTNTVELPCKSICDSVADACAGAVDQGMLAQFGITLPDCTDTTKWQPNPTCELGPTTVVDAMVLKPSCETYSGTVCGDDVPGKVYVPAGFSQAVLEAVGQQMQFLFAVSPRSTECDRFMQGFTCARTFLLCDETTLAPERVLPLPRLPCGTFCDSFNARCAPLWAAAPALVAAGISPNCSTTTFGELLSCDGLTVLSAGQPNYPPVTAQTTDFGGITTTCSNWTAAGAPTTDMASAVTAVHAQCPAPLVKPDDANWPTIMDGACSDPCPMLIWTRDEYKHMDRLAIGVAVTSLICSFILALTWLVFPQHRSKRYILYLTLSIFIFTLVNFITFELPTGDQTVAESLCATNTNERHMKGWCAFQGIVFSYLVGTAVSWWLVQAVDLFMKVVMSVKIVPGSTFEVRREILFQLFAWGLPLIPTIAGLAYDQIGAHAIGQPWCLFSNARNHNSTFDVSWGFWIVPMFVYCCIGVVLMICILIKLAYTSYQSRKSGTTYRSPWTPYIRVLVFMGIMVYTWSFMFAYKLITQDNGAKWTASATEFIICLLFTQFTTPGMLGECGVVPAERLSATLMDALIVATTMPGILLFLLYGTNLEIYQCWAGLMYKHCGCSCFSRFADKKLDKNTVGPTNVSRSRDIIADPSASLVVGAAANSPASPTAMASPRSTTSLFGKNNKTRYGNAGTASGNRTGGGAGAASSSGAASPPGTNDSVAMRRAGDVSSSGVGLAAAATAYEPAAVPDPRAMPSNMFDTRSTVRSEAPPANLYGAGAGTGGVANNAGADPTAGLYGDSASFGAAGLYGDNSNSNSNLEAPLRPMQHTSSAVNTPSRFNTTGGAGKRPPAMPLPPVVPSYAASGNPYDDDDDDAPPPPPDDDDDGGDYRPGGDDDDDDDDDDRGASVRFPGMKTGGSGRWGPTEPAPGRHGAAAPRSKSTVATAPQPPQRPYQQPYQPQPPAMAVPPVPSFVSNSDADNAHGGGHPNGSGRSSGHSSGGNGNGNAFGPSEVQLSPVSDARPTPKQRLSEPVHAPAPAAPAAAAAPVSAMPPSPAEQQKLLIQQHEQRLKAQQQRAPDFPIPAPPRPDRPGR